MKILNIDTKECFMITSSLLESVGTKSLYVRTGFINKTKFISQRGNGAGGAGDVCRLDSKYIEVRNDLYTRLFIYSQKAQAIN